MADNSTRPTVNELNELNATLQFVRAVKRHHHAIADAEKNTKRFVLLARSARVQDEWSSDQYVDAMRSLGEILDEHSQVYEQFAKHIEDEFRDELPMLDQWIQKVEDMTNDTEKPTLTEERLEEVLEYGKRAHKMFQSFGTQEEPAKDPLPDIFHKALDDILKEKGT